MVCPPGPGVKRTKGACGTIPAMATNRALVRRALSLALLAALALPAKAKPGPTVTLAAVGDILLDRGVARQIKEKGAGYPFERIRQLIGRPDIAIGNLECPLTRHPMLVPKRFVFQSDPRLAPRLKRSGFTMLNLANNHTLDSGRTGLADTMAALDRAGIGYCGAGASLAAAQQPRVITVKGLKIGFLGFCDTPPEAVYPAPSLPSVAMCSIDEVVRVVAAAATKVDIVVVSFHWGVEYDTRPTPRQCGLARAAVAAGATLVLGSHPHVVQGFEMLPRIGDGRGVVAYSLGNFVFDPRIPEAARSCVLTVTMDRTGVRSARFVPVTIDGCRPRPARPAEAEAIRREITERTLARSTRVEGTTLRYPERPH